MHDQAGIRLRIGLITPSLIIGGTEKHIVKLSNFLFSRNAHVSIFVLSENIDPGLINKINNNITLNIFSGNLLRKVHDLRKAIKESDLNCIMGFLTLGNILLLILPNKLRKIGTIRNNPQRKIRNSPKLILLQLAYLISDLVITNNLGSNFTFLKKKLLFIPNSVKLRETNITKVVGNKSKINIVTCSNLRPVKGLAGYILTLSKLSNQTKNLIKITVVGRGKLESEIRELLISSGIEFSLKTDIEDVSEELQNSDIYVHPSISEGFSNSILEAMSFGLPIVSSNVGSAETQLGSKKFLYNLSSKNNDLISLLEEFINNSELRKAEGERNLLRVIENFAEEKLELGYIDAFKSIGFTL